MAFVHISGILVEVLDDLKSKQDFSKKHKLVILKRKHFKFNSPKTSIGFKLIGNINLMGMR